MNTDDLRLLLADRAESIDTSHPDRVVEVHGRIHTARRRRAAGAVAGAAALAAAVIAIAVVVPGSSEHSDGPIDQPLPTVKPVEEPPGQTEIAAAFGPEDMIHGNVAIGSGTNEPGATELHASMPHPDTDNAYVVGFCRGSEDVWWVSTGTYGQCSPDAPLEAPPPVEFQPGGNAPWPLPGPGEQADMEIRVDMWLTEPLSAQSRACIEGQIDPYSLREECIESDRGVTLLKSVDASFGFTAYVHSAPQVVDNPLGGGFEALANLAGTEYVFTRGVASAPRAERLAMYLGISELPRLVLLVQRDMAEDPLTLLVDGEPASFPTDLVPGSPWERLLIAGTHGLVPPGSHNVTVHLPPDTKAELLVYEAQTEE